VLAPSGAGTGARWAASGWNTPLAAQWADSRTAWREEIRAVMATPLKLCLDYLHESLIARIVKIDFRTLIKTALDIPRTSR